MRGRGRPPKNPGSRQPPPRRRGGGAGGRGRVGGRGAPAPMPWDSQAERESAELDNEAGDTRTQIASDYQRSQEELGFGAGADDPYSQAALLKERREASRRGIMATAGNQLYAGSTVNAQRGTQRQFDIGYQQLQDTAARDQAVYNTGTGRIQRDEQLGLGAIKEGALNRAAASEPPPLAAGNGKRRQGGRRQRRPRRGRGRL